MTMMMMMMAPADERPDESPWPEPLGSSGELAPGSRPYRTAEGHLAAPAATKVGGQLNPIGRRGLVRRQLRL